MSIQIPMFETSNSKPKMAALVEEIGGGAFEVKKFVENFDVLASANGGISCLRQLVLELAVRGRLVTPSGREDSPDQLFSEIEKKRAQLVAERRASRADDLRPVSAEETPFTIPPSWRWVRFGRATICRDGQRVPVSKEERSGRSGPYDYYGASGVIDKIDRYIFNEPLLLIGEDGANLVNRASPIAFIASGKYWVNNHAHVLDSASFDMLQFLAVFVNAIDLKPYVTGTAQPKMNQAKMNAIPVAIPPLAEQKRIVAKVDELMHLLDDLEARQAKKRVTQARLRTAALDALTSAAGPEEFEGSWKRVSKNFGVLLDEANAVRLLRATILELAVRGRLCRRKAGGRSGRDLLAEAAQDRQRLLTEGSIREPKAGHRGPEQLSFELPEGWEWGLIGETFDVVGGLQKTPARTPTRHHYPYLRVENVQRGRLDLDRMERFEVSDDELRRLRLQRGDLLVVEGNGSETEIGRCARWEGTIENCIHQNHIIRCRSLGPMSGEFTLLFLNSPSGIAEMKRLAITTSGLYSLSVGKVRGIAVPIPGEKERDETLAKVEHLMKLCDDLEAKLRRGEETAGKLVEAVVAEMVG